MTEMTPEEKGIFEKNAQFCAAAAVLLTNLLGRDGLGVVIACYNKSDLSRPMFFTGNGDTKWQIQVLDILVKSMAGHLAEQPTVLN